MISAFVNTLKIPELRSRILFTVAMIFIVRIGVAITLPGVNPDVLQGWIDAREGISDGGGSMVMGMLNIFSGGGLANCAIFALGIMPYISASIMVQLLTAVVPSLQKISREDGGRQKIGQYTRFLTVLLCLLQGYMLAKSLEDPKQTWFLPGLAEFIVSNGGIPLVTNPGFGFQFIAVLTMTAGTLLMMWLGEQITERGIGNGVSLLICVNIVSGIPSAFIQLWSMFIGGDNASPANALKLVLLIALLVFIIAGVIAITQAQRRIPVQYAKRVVGRKVYGGQTQYLPLKVNYAGVMPIIFAQAIVTFPSMFLAGIFRDSPGMQRFLQTIQQGWIFHTLEVILIFFFSYFWVATMFKPQEIASDLQKAGGYVPGKQPGKPTADFLDHTMSRLTLAGSVFLAFLAIFPAIVANIIGIGSLSALHIFGGTSLLILVGVLLDVMRQTETHLMQRHYDGFLRKGKIRGRSDRSYGGGNIANRSTLVWIWFGIAFVAIIAVTFALGKGLVK
jgi:preprotein translocase subunit SecY